jgi:cytochrome P450
VQAAAKNAASSVDESEILAELRRSCRVSTLRPGVQFVVRYEDVARVLRDYEHFSGARPSTLGGVRAQEELTLQELDEPRHSELRRILLISMPRAAIMGVEPYMEEVCQRLVGKLVHRRQANLVAELIEPAAKACVAEVVGIPAADRELVYRWTAEIREDEAASAPPVRERGARAAREGLNGWIAEQARRRRASTQLDEDVFTRLLAARDTNGRRLTETEFATQIRFLCRAGIGSIVRMTGNLLYELIRVPERYHRVLANRDLVPAAIDESLRHDPPGTLMARTCVRETGIGGVPIQVGDQVILSITSAHRDEAEFPQGEQFDLDRCQCSRHLGFGRGRHRCPGAPLARAVASHVLNAFMDYVADVRLAPGFVYESKSFNARGPQRLDVEYGPAEPVPKT